tara:strand:- start:2203 stop:2496 length:294 start_codon:yes stop_codon:yes gene_type:complete
MAMKIFYTVALIIFLSLQYSLFLSENSLISYYYLKDKLEQNQSDLTKYKFKNNSLQTEIKNIKNNNEYLEVYAREKFGLIKSNEIFFQIIKNENQDN